MMDTLMSESLPLVYHFMSFERRSTWTLWEVSNLCNLDVLVLALRDHLIIISLPLSVNTLNFRSIHNKLRDTENAFMTTSIELTKRFNALQLKVKGSGREGRRGSQEGWGRRRKVEGSCKGESRYH
jgi:hypothetical protein